MSGKGRPKRCRQIHFCHLFASIFGRFRGLMCFSVLWRVALVSILGQEQTAAGCTPRSTEYEGPAFCTILKERKISPNYLAKSLSNDGSSGSHFDPAEAEIPDFNGNQQWNFQRPGRLSQKLEIACPKTFSLGCFFFFLGNGRRKMYWTKMVQTTILVKMTLFRTGF